MHRCICIGIHMSTPDYYTVDASGCQTQWSSARVHIPFQRRQTMYARVTTVPIQRDKISEATSIYQNDILPIISGTQGCQGAYLLVDPTSGNGMSITMWDNPANAQAYESSGTYQQLVAKLAQYFAGPP